MASIKLNIKTSSGAKFQIEIASLSETIAQFKGRLEALSNIPAESQRLIYRGHVLKDSQTLQDIKDKQGIESGHTMHLVRGKPSPKNPPNSANASRGSSTPINNQRSTNGPAVPSGAGGMNPFGLGGGSFEEMQRQMMQDPEQVRQMMNNPMMQSMLNNPEMVQQMMMANPQVRQMIENNPEIGHVLRDPTTFRQMIQLMRNPSLMNEMQRNTDRQMANIEMMPEGFNALRRMHENIQAPLMDAAAEATRNRGRTRANNSVSDNPFTSLFEDEQPQNTPSTAPMPNPWAPTQEQANNTANRGAAGNAPDFSMLFGNAGGQDGRTGGGGIPGMPPGFDQEAMLQMLENPVMQQAMESMFSSPEMVENMLNNNQAMRQLVEANPQIAQVIRSPELLRLAMNPAFIRSAMQFRNFVQGGGGRTESTGTSPTNTVGADAQTGSGEQPSGNGESPALNFANMLRAMGNVGAAGGGANATQNNLSQEQLEEMYRSQLAQLRDMGFLDTQMCLEALRATGGNVSAAVERLLRQLGG